MLMNVKVDNIYDLCNGKLEWLVPHHSPLFLL